MRKLIAKLIFIVIIINIMMSSKAFGANVGIVSTDKTVTSGTDSSVTVTISSKISLGSYEVRLTNTGGLTLTGASGGEVSADNKMVTSASSAGTTTLASFTFNVPKVSTQTKYNVQFSISAMEDTNFTSYEKTTNTATITVNPAPAQETEQDKETESNTGSNGNTGGTSSEEPRYPTETTPQKPQEKPKSSNNYLSGITLGAGTLSPEFYRETYEYTVEFDDTVNLYDLKEIEVSASAEDERATVNGAGTIQLNDGENNITLTVKAENGSERTYTIKLVKPMPVEQSALRLNTLVINGINSNGEYQTINIEFNPETFEYNVIVPNEITALSINPTTENEDILIETIGGESLNEGNNKIIIILTSPSDETVKTTYTINVERQTGLVTNEQGLTKEQIGIIIIASIVGLILLIVIIVAIVKHHKKKKGFDYDDEEDDEEMPFINNEEGENVEDYDEVEDPYPSKILINTENNEEEIITYEDQNKNIQEELNKQNKINNDKLSDKKDNDDELKIKTTENEENMDSEDTKNRNSKWDDFIKGYDDEEDEPKAKKKKQGKRFL